MLGDFVEFIEQITFTLTRNNLIFSTHRETDFFYKSNIRGRCIIVSHQDRSIEHFCVIRIIREILTWSNYLMRHVESRQFYLKCSTSTLFFLTFRQITLQLKKLPSAEKRLHLKFFSKSPSPITSQC